MGQPMDHDHEPVGSMHPFEPFEPADRDDHLIWLAHLILLGHFNWVAHLIWLRHAWAI